ncbi:hypothetical protein BOTBODRAFT_456030 [Botryobasidium botryosum FD-172 SS1]|uniref:Uncharacterized protein n=1 Tax=Botryobasidium botryosum (strain FD-172 SS1) TaxID=930990 RepID=A0A067MIS9_BOTB1|nr:hypothetical protein BOTBODRAFT_456030 [Botryobasidium botryosum FD-172 SS1]
MTLTPTFIMMMMMILMIMIFIINHTILNIMISTPCTSHIFIINKFHTLHPPKLASYYHPPTYMPDTKMAYFITGGSHSLATILLLALNHGNSNDP